MIQEFDYIVVGAGSAGCVVASRLSEDPAVSVCLLEAGGPDKSPLIHVPAGVIFLLSGKSANWAYQTVPQPGLNNRRGFQPRGKTLGGSSSINAMLYVRGNRWDYDNWVALGNPGWSYDDVLPYFRKSEDNERLDDAFHGQGGELGVSDPQCASELNTRWIEACADNGIPFNVDCNGAHQGGSHITQRTVRGGERCSAARAFITPNTGRSNLTIITGARTEKILIEGKRATGVRYRSKKASGVQESGELRARREVIVCAGAFGSPQLLMLSGIGVAAELAEHGIDPVVELPGVGRNLHDHIDYVISYKAPSRSDTFGLSVRGVCTVSRAIVEWVRHRRGKMTSTYAEAGAFIETSDGLVAPDIQFVFVVAIVDDHGRKLHPGHGFSCHATVLRPHSVGELRLASANSADAPLIDPAFLEDERDLETLVRGSSIMQRILESPAFDDIRGTMVYPVKTGDTEAMKADIRRRADTQYHPVGTCKMGSESDPLAVVDNRLRVKGIEALRVADASIMPRVVSGNTNAAAIMIGERAVDFILGRDSSGG